MTPAVEIFREWDLYDRIGRANYMKQREIAASIRVALGHRAGPLRVLDLGCGDGKVIHEILAGAHVSEFVGVDLSQSALDRFGDRPAPGAAPDEVRRTLIRGDLEAELATMPAAAFDLVHAGYSLHHLRSEAKQKALGEIARVLDRGGLLIWTDIIRRGGESRDDYILRLATEIGSNWDALTPEERRSVVEHVSSSDHPEAESWMIGQAETRGLRFAEQLFHDDYYVTLMFMK